MATFSYNYYIQCIYVEILTMFLFGDFAVFGLQMHMYILYVFRNIEQPADIFLGMCLTRSSSLKYFQ